MSKTMYYFDMDGVIADWVSAYNAVAPMPLEEFNALTREQRTELKREFFNYEFFYEMPVLESGMNMIRSYIEAGADVTILSATGYVNKYEVLSAKLDWVKKHLGSDIEVKFVDKVEHKHTKKNQKFDNHVLIDDRVKAIDAWVENGGIGILFQ